jgi:nucleolar protein 16
MPPCILNSVTDICHDRNQNETLSQNYARLGLASRLNSVSGGVEKLRPGEISKTSTASKLTISHAVPKNIAPREARVERDPETGKIIRVIHEPTKPNPLNDPLNSDEEDEEFTGFEDEAPKPQNDIIRQLEEQASFVGEKKERKQSEREKEWIERLVGKYGEDYTKMFRDRRLNPMQQTEADIKRRVQKWKAAGGTVLVE